MTPDPTRLNDSQNPRGEGLPREGGPQGGPRDSHGGSHSHGGKGPKSFLRRDERLHEEINEMLYKSHAIDASEIEVQVEEGVVFLTGRVPERLMKYWAEELVERIPGVKGVHNNLRVTA